MFFFSASTTGDVATVVEARLTSDHQAPRGFFVQNNFFGGADRLHQMLAVSPFAQADPRLLKQIQTALLTAIPTLSLSKLPVILVNIE